MKHCLIIFLFILCSVQSNAQEDSYQEIDRKMISMPDANNLTTGRIATFINENFITDREKARAIHRWVTFHIRYSTDSMFVFNWGGDPQKKVVEAMRRRKGVCENYAAIFNDIATKCLLKNYIVNGYTKQHGVVDKVGHSWCAVFVNGNWYFCDPTWDEGYNSESSYFLIPATDFINTHMPFDPLWQLLKQPISHEDFYKSIMTENLKQSSPDSVDSFLQLDELQQLEASAHRIKLSEVNNELARVRLAYLEMQAGIFYEQKDSSLYQKAVEELNAATKAFNEFIQFRNNQFLPEKTNTEITGLLNKVEWHLSLVTMALTALEKSDSNVQYDTGFCRETVYNLSRKLQTQYLFVKKYFQLEKTDRLTVFME